MLHQLESLIQVENGHIDRNLRLSAGGCCAYGILCVCRHLFVRGVWKLWMERMGQVEVTELVTEMEMVVGMVYCNRGRHSEHQNTRRKVV